MFRTDNQENFPWKQVFKRCHSVDLLNLEKVCKRFHQLISLNNLFWKDLCARDGVEIPPNHITDSPNEQKQTFNYRYLYHFASKGHVNPYGPNIIADLPINAKQAEECTLEEPPIGYDLKKGPAKCLATSNSWGWRLIMVNLEKCGIEPWILDDVRPTIIVTEKHAPRSDCGAIYMFGAEMAESEEKLLEKLRFPTENGALIERKYAQKADEPTQPNNRIIVTLHEIVFDRIDTNKCKHGTVFKLIGYQPPATVKYWSGVTRDRIDEFKKNYEALNSLDHPNLIKFMKCVESSTDPQERFAVVTEYYERGTLSNCYLHGDINPGNIFITKDWSIKKALFLMVLKKNQDLMQIKWNW
ncbi:unnamed protein product, partial [Mesorhabditis belari]|uniref:Protein kinase domain-containing protein n=1 Tax=Mesorhabditis belari TaxID=2138241 RepID=A0AAF3FGU2_9BILA